MLKRLLPTILCVVLLPGAARAANAGDAPVKLVQKFSDRRALSNYLRAFGYKARGGRERVHRAADAE